MRLTLVCASARQWRWSLQFLGQCNDAAFERNVAQLVALGSYSHAALKEIVPEYAPANRAAPA